MRSSSVRDRRIVQHLEHFVFEMKRVHRDCKSFSQYEGSLRACARLSGGLLARRCYTKLRTVFIVCVLMSVHLRRRVRLQHTCNDRLSLAIKSSGRVVKVVQLLRSINMHIPCVPIVLVDDGPRSIKSELRHYTGIPWSRLAIKEMPYDSGLAAGRNLLIHTISTDFLVISMMTFR